MVSVRAKSITFLNARSCSGVRPIFVMAAATADPEAVSKKTDTRYSFSVRQSSANCRAVTLHLRPRNEPLSSRSVLPNPPSLPLAEKQVPQLHALRRGEPH